MLIFVLSTVVANAEHATEQSVAVVVPAEQEFVEEDVLLVLLELLVEDDLMLVL